jgi:hypothetical protein
MLLTDGLIRPTKLAKKSLRSICRKEECHIMQINRKQFALGLTTAMAGAGIVPGYSNAAGGSHSMPTTPAASGQTTYLFKNSSFEYVFLIALGRAYHQAGNIGKVLYLSRQVPDGDFESAYQAFKQAGDEASAIALESESKGHRESARQAYLWAQNYYDSATYFVDGSQDPSRFLPTWELLYASWLKAVALFDQPVSTVRIPYEKTELHGFYFKEQGTSGKRPLLIMSNGSDGSMLDMLTMGGAGALARGYDLLTFDGPGQGYALWKQGLYFRPDWEKVITPAVDYALSQLDVDPKRIALLGISQSGYWVPRAVAFEKRIAAAIADPGVVDVSTLWTATLPKPMIELLDAGQKAEFDGFMIKELDPATKAALNFRMRPFGFTSYYDTFKATMDYRLNDVAKQISCPMLVTEPVNEAFWPGQSRQLYDLLTAPKTLIPFSESDGADLHCEPKGYGVRDLRIFNWLDETLR